VSTALAGRDGQTRTFDFQNPCTLIALAKLTLSGLCPLLLGRAAA
jgi:hypothetical protein